MKYLYLLLCTLLGFDVMAQTGQPSEFTQIRQELQKKWPDNRTVTLYFMDTVYLPAMPTHLM